MSDVLALADRFFKAIEAGDVETVRSIYAPDAVIWHNSDPLGERDTGQSARENLEVIGKLPQRITSLEYEVFQREATESGFVQQHVLRGRMRNGEAFVMPACIICRVENGRITRLDEYFDPSIRARSYEIKAEVDGFENR